MTGRLIPRKINYNVFSNLLYYIVSGRSHSAARSVPFALSFRVPIHLYHIQLHAHCSLPLEWRPVDRCAASPRFRHAETAAQ